MKRFSLRVCALAAVIFLIPGRAAPRDVAAPRRLSIAVYDIYGKASACECVRAIADREYGPFLDRLRDRFGLQLEFTSFTEPYLLERAIREGRFDGAICKPWTLLRDGKGRRFQRLADLQDPTGNTQLWGELIVLRDSPVKQTRDLIGKRIALGQPDSYEKHHAALALLAREGVELLSGRRFERASCLECLDLLLKGQVDAAFISNYALTADCAVDIAEAKQFRVLARTASIPLTSLLIDVQRLSPAEADHLADALIQLSRTDLPDCMRGGGFVPPAPWQPAELPARGP